MKMKDLQRTKKVEVGAGGTLIHETLNMDLEVLSIKVADICGTVFRTY